MRMQQHAQLSPHLRCTEAFCNCGIKSEQPARCYRVHTPCYGIVSQVVRVSASRGSAANLKMNPGPVPRHTEVTQLCWRPNACARACQALYIVTWDACKLLAETERTLRHSSLSPMPTCEPLILSYSAPRSGSALIRPFRLYMIYAA